MPAHGSGTKGPGPSETPKSSLLAASGFAAGLLMLFAFFSEVLTPAPDLTRQIALYQTNGALYALRSFGWASFAIGAIPFFALLGTVLRPRSAEGAFAATLLSVVGSTLVALRGILQDSGLAAAATIAAPSPAEAVYQANVWFAAANPLLPLGAAIWGLGFILFGMLARGSGILPNWLGTVAFVGGVAGWLIFPVLPWNAEFPGYFFEETLLPFTTVIWGFACGAIFLRRSSLATA